MLIRPQVAHSKRKRGFCFQNPLFTWCVIPLGFEPKTHSLEGCCSIQLSYGTRNFCKSECKITHLYPNADTMHNRHLNILTVFNGALGAL